MPDKARAGKIMNFRSRLANIRLSKKSKIIICSAAVTALLITSIGIVNHHSRQTENDSHEVAAEVNHKGESGENSSASKADSEIEEARAAYNEADTNLKNLKSDASSTEKLNANQNAMDAAENLIDTLNKSGDKEQTETEIAALKKRIEELEKENKSLKEALAKAETKKQDQSKKTNGQSANNKSTVAANNKPAATAKAKSDAATPRVTQNSKQSSKQNSVTGSNTTRQNNKQSQRTQQSAPRQVQTPVPKKQTCHVVNHPAVTHQEPVYQTVHHNEVSHMENYVVTPAWDEQVVVGNLYECNFCHQRFNTLAEIEEHSDWVHDSAASYRDDIPVYKTVHHDAVMGQRKVVDNAAYDERVQTGTRTVTDKAAWSENVCN